MCAFVLSALPGILWLMPVWAQVMDYSSLPNWDKDNHVAALDNFKRSCDFLDQHDLQPALFIGYCKPDLQGSAVSTRRFSYRIYQLPPELRGDQVLFDRATIERGKLRGRGLDIAWLDDPVEVFFLHIQGSGRIKMTDGRILRIGYAGRNRYAHKLVGAALVHHGYLAQDHLSAQSIGSWVRANPSAGADLLNYNPPYVFFGKLPDLAEDQGPNGAMGGSITALRSVAVDQAHWQLGALVRIGKAGVQPMHRLVVAPVTGRAIKGAQRADIFYGTRHETRLVAGENSGRILMQMPVERAFAIPPDG